MRLLWWKKTKNVLIRVLCPIFWIQNEPTCWKWDAELNRMLNESEIRDGSFHHGEQYTVFINDVEIWVQNWPYSYGYVYDGRPKILPSILTRIRLRRAIKAFLAKQAQ